MKYLFYFSLLAGLSLSGCGQTKTADPAPTLANAQLTCTIQGAAFTQPAVAAYLAGSPQANTLDQLTITAEDANRKQIRVLFTKKSGAPDSEYRLRTTYYDVPGNRLWSCVNATSGAISKSASGWSGTFSGTAVDVSNGNVLGKVENGSFHNVPQ